MLWTTCLYELPCGSYDKLYLLISLLRANLLAFEQAREIQDYSGGSNTTVSCGVKGAE